VAFQATGIPRDVVSAVPGRARLPARLHRPEGAWVTGRGVARPERMLLAVSLAMAWPWSFYAITSIASGVVGVFLGGRAGVHSLRRSQAKPVAGRR
jgi:hypothetical protein